MFVKSYLCAHHTQLFFNNVQSTSYKTTEINGNKNLTHLHFNKSTLRTLYMPHNHWWWILSITIQLWIKRYIAFWINKSRFFKSMWQLIFLFVTKHVEHSFEEHTLPNGVVGHQQVNYLWNEDEWNMRTKNLHIDKNLSLYFEWVFLFEWD